MSPKNCPNCDEEMEHEEYDPEVGIQGGWYCSTCEEAFPYEEDDSYIDDRE